MGQFSSCCCNPAPPYATRSIWTSRPFGIFRRPFDSAAYAAADDLDVLGGPDGTDVVGITKEVGLGEPLIYPWPRPAVPDNSDILWVGTRYLQQTRITIIDGTYGELGDPYHWEQRIYNYADPNTGYEWTITVADAPLDPPIGESQGYLTSWDETMSETSWTLDKAYQYGTESVAVTLAVPITYADQVARCKNHLDYIVGTMTAAKIRNPMTLTGTPNRNWVYSPVVGTTTPGSFIKATPITGTFEVISEVGVYTEWAFDSQQILDTNSYASSRHYAIYGACENFGSIQAYPTTDEFVTYAASAGRIPFGGGITDDAAPVVQYLCYAYDVDFNCTNLSDNGYTEIDAALSTDQPTWGDSLACFTPAQEGDAGWYFFSPDGIVASPTGLTHNFTLPGSDYWIFMANYSPCCPP